MTRLTREQKDTEQNQIKRQDISHETKDTPQRGADHITEFTRAPRHGRDSQKSSDRDRDNRPDFIPDTLVSLLFGLNLLRLRLRFGRRRAGIVFCCFILGAGRPAGPRLLSAIPLPLFVLVVRFIFRRKLPPYAAACSIGAKIPYKTTNRPSTHT